MHDHEIQNILTEEGQCDRKAHESAVERGKDKGINADVLQRRNAKQILAKHPAQYCRTNRKERGAEQRIESRREGIIGQFFGSDR